MAKAKKTAQNTFIPVLCWSIIIRIFALFFFKQDMWHDAAFTVLFAERPLSFIFGINDVHPPLFYILMHFWLKITHNELWIRSFNIVTWAMFIYAFYKLAVRKLTPIGAYFTILFMGMFSTTMLYYSLEPRNYMLGMFLVITQVYYFYKAIDDKRYLKHWALLTIFMLYTHFFTALALIVEFIIIVKHHAKKLKSFIEPMFWVALASIPLAVYFSIALFKVRSFWFKTITLKSFVSSISFQFFLPKTTIAMHGYWLGAFIILTLWFVFRSKRCDETLFFFVPVTIIWLISQLHPIYHHRFFLFYAFALYLLLGKIIDALLNHKSKAVVFIGIIFVLFTGACFAYSLSNFENTLPTELSESSTLLKQSLNKTQHYNFIHTSTFSMTPYRFYFEGYNISHYLLTNLTKKELFTAGGSVVIDNAIINKSMLAKLKPYYFVTDTCKHAVPSGVKVIYYKGGLVVYYENK